MDQQIHDKIVQFRKNPTATSYATVLMRAQLIYDYGKFIDYWENEMNARISQINKNLKYIDDHPEDRRYTISKIAITSMANS